MTRIAIAVVCRISAREGSSPPLLLTSLSHRDSAEHSCKVSRVEVEAMLDADQPREPTMTHYILSGH